MNLKKLTLNAEKELEDNDYLPVNSNKEPRFYLNEVLECFSKKALIHDNIITLVGSLAIKGKGHDVDLVINTNTLNEHEREGLVFRLYRAFSDYFNIPYSDVADYLHIHFSDSGAYTNYIPLYALAIIPSPNSCVHKMSKKSKNKNSRIIAGYASVNIIDLENDYIPLSTLKEMWNKWQKQEDFYKNLMLEHEGIVIGHILDKWGKLRSEVDAQGLFIIAKLRDDLEIANEVWNKILNSELNAFSIRIEILDKELQCKKNKCFDYIKSANLIEISIVKNPANPLARFYILNY